jgi:hypothetical protein
VLGCETLATKGKIKAPKEAKRIYSMKGLQETIIK